MNTFEEAQAEALKARQAIDKLEAMHGEKTKDLAAKREEFASYELGAIDTLQKLEGEISEARRELQAALQRQNDAPIGKGFVPALEAEAEEKPAEEKADESAVGALLDREAAAFDKARENFLIGSAAPTLTVGVGDSLLVNPFTGASERFNS